MLKISSLIKFMPVVALFAFFFGIIATPVMAYNTIDEARLACGTRTVVVDFSCQRQKLLNPEVSCGLYICEGDSEFCASGSNCGSSGGALNLNFFGVRINATESNLLQVIVFVGFNLFLGVVMLTLAVYGVWGAYLRATAESDDQLQKASKTLTNAIVGLVIIATSFVVTQLVASFLGLGSINQIVEFSTINLQ